MPCFNAFQRLVFFPASVRGPVDLAAFRRFAFHFRNEIAFIRSPFCRLLPRPGQTIWLTERAHVILQTG